LTAGNNLQSHWCRTAQPAIKLHTMALAKVQWKAKGAAFDVWWILLDHQWWRRGPFSLPPQPSAFRLLTVNDAPSFINDYGAVASLVVSTLARPAMSMKRACPMAYHPPKRRSNALQCESALFLAVGALCLSCPGWNAPIRSRALAGVCFGKPSF